MADDAELLKAYAVNRSEAAFAEFVSRHLGLVYSAALRRTGGDPHQAEEIAQQVFISVARNAGTLSRHRVLAGWLYTSTRNAVFAAARSDQRRLARQGEALAMQQADTPNTSDGDWARLRPALDAVMDALSPRDREAILLHFFERKSYREIGEQMACAEDAARMRITRALERMKFGFGQKGIASTTGALALALAGQSVVAAPPGLASVIASTALTAAATAGAGSGTALGLFKLMTTTKASMGVLGAVCLLSIGTALFEARQAREATDAIAAAHAASARTIQGLQARLSAAERSLAVPPSTSAPQPAPRPTGKVSAGPRQDDPNEDPAFAPLRRKNLLRVIQQQYGYAFAQLNLPPGDLAKLKQLLLARMEARFDANALAAEAGFSGREVETAQHQAEDSVTDEIKALVGDTGYAALQASFKASQYAPLIAGSVGYDLDAAGVPLMPRQTVALAQFFATHDPSADQAAAAQVPDPQTGLTPYYQSLLDQLSATLTPDQIPVMKDYFLELEQQAQYRRQHPPGS